MASISSTLRLNDGMTPTMRKINRVMGIMINNFETTQRLSGQAIDTKAIASAKAGYNEVNSALDRMEQNYQDCSRHQKKLNDNMNAGAKSAENLLSKMKGITATYLSIQSAKKLVELSDIMTSSKARLSLIVDDGGSVEELQQKIFNSAQNARGVYTDTMATIAKLGITAENAFSSNDELIKFTELVNKNFVVGGATSSEQNSAMLQLSQAMSAGVLQGDEYRTIRESAPLLYKSIEDYMRNVKKAQGSMKDWASEGLLTADVIKAAVFNSAEEVEMRFSQMPWTWSQVWTTMKNQAIIALEPVLSIISNAANNPKVINTLKKILNLFSKMVTVGAKVIAFLLEHESLLYATATAIGLYLLPVLSEQIHKMGIATASWAAHNWQLMICVTTGAILAGVLYSMGVSFEWIAVAIAGVVLAYGAWQVAQWALNGATYACPILAIIMAVIAAIVILVILFKKFTKEIVGALFVAGAFFKNIGLWCANLGLAIWSVIKNIGLWCANLGLAIWAVIKNIGLWFGNLGQTVWSIIKNVGLWFANLGLGIWNVMKAAANNVATAFSNGWINIQIGFWSMLNVIMQGLTSLAELANRTLGWMGVNIDTSGLDFAANKIDELNAKKSEYTNVGQAWQEGFSTFAYDDLAKSWTTYGYDSVSGAMNTFAYDDVAKSFGTFGIFEDGWASSAYASGSAAGAGIQNWMNENLTMDKALGALGLDGLGGMGYDIAGVADDTSDISDTVSKSNEELKYLRDIAEREAINRFTTAEVKLDFSGMTNRIDSDMDIDGVIERLTDGFTEALVTAAEGVHT